MRGNTQELTYSDRNKNSYARLPNSRKRWRIIKKSIVLLIFVAVLTPIALWQVAEWSRHYALSVIKDTGDQTLRLVVTNLRGELARFQNFPPLLAGFNNDLINFLLSPDDKQAVKKTNLLLEKINRTIGALDTYVIDRYGQTIAASNWNMKRSFIGRNYGFRPYFQQAMSNKLGRYFALGTASNEKGYYFSYPVTYEAEIIGVIVVKTRLEHFEERWKSRNYEVIVSDDNGVIFLSSNPDWNYHALRELNDKQRRSLVDSRQYSGTDGRTEFKRLQVAHKFTDPEFGQLIHIRQPRKDKKNTRLGHSIVREYLVQDYFMNEAEWKVSLLSPTDQVKRSQTITMIVTAFILLSIIFMAAFVFERRRRIIEGIALQEQARLTLERRVEERTVDLAETNKKLRNEINERKLTEAELRKTQNELIQAGRLAALGKLSANISHELNQPLAAIRSYADNARAYLERQNQKAAFSNLFSISELVDRMARIIKNLKTYSTQDTKNLRAISVQRALQEAISLLEQKIEDSRLVLVESYPDGDCTVIGGELRLQQVFVNLISNAIDAVEENKIKELYVSLSRHEEYALVTLRDTGQGVNRDNIAHIFDPFFTTKDIGKGVGLGLSITYGIIRQFGGSIEVDNHINGGAVFRVKLKLSDIQASKELLETGVEVV